MKKRIVSLLLSLVFIFSMLPTVAMANGTEDYITVFNYEVNAGQYFDGGSGKVVDTAPTSNYLYYAGSGQITLNSFVYSNMNISNAITSENKNVSITLNGENSVESDDKHFSLSIVGGKLSISGDGSLSCNGGIGCCGFELTGGTVTCMGVSSVGDIIISDGELIVSSGSSALKATNGHNITISGGKITGCTTAYGLYCVDGSVTIKGGEIELVATDTTTEGYGLAVKANTITIGEDMQIFAGESKDDAAAVDSYSSQRYVKITPKAKDLVITGGTAGTDYTYENGVLEIKAAGTYKISNADGVAVTDDIIKVSAPSGNVNITLAGVNIATTTGMSAPAFEITGDCVTGIILEDNTNNILNSYESKDVNYWNYAGLQNGEKHLSISCEHSKEAEHSCGTACGSLEAIGGRYAACIGGGYKMPGRNITISGGNVTADFSNNQKGSAGIGGGSMAEGSDITITGGIVVASSGNGAGIGGGYTKSGFNITISGGTVTAASVYGAGIGGGDEGDGNNITISGGMVTATSKTGAGIGGGASREGSNITITGGTIIATSEEGAGIGSGLYTDFDEGTTISPAAENIKIIPAANTRIYAYNGSNSTGSALEGSPFTSETNITDLLSGNAFYSYSEHVHSFSTEWSYDADEHWHNSTCGHDVVSDKAEHRGGTASCANKAVCSDCGAEYGSFAEHSFSSDWSYDADKHWHDSTCGHDVVSDEAAHEYGNDRTCDTCGYTKPIVIIPTAPTYPPIVDCGENGNVTVSPCYPEQGDTVIITPDPDEGYEVDEIIVTDRSGNPVEVVDNGDGTYSFIQPNGKVTIEVTFKKIACPGDSTCPMYPYTDLDASLWYHDGIHYCIENGLMQGIGNNEFAPNTSLSRAMLVTILWRLEGSPIVNYLMDLEDVAADRWYTEAIRWAASEKLVEGYGNGKFGTNDAITREQMVTIMYRYAKYKGYDVSVGENTNILSYDDAFDVAEYAIPAMQWACGSGMIQGIADGSKMNLAPQGNATRAQAAAILQRYCENVANN